MMSDEQKEILRKIEEGFEEAATPKCNICKKYEACNDGRCMSCQRNSNFKDVYREINNN